MKWLRDGRLGQRPHYDPAELDRECEALVAAFLRRRHGAVRYPISTDDLAVLVEQEADDLDLYADLSADGPGVEGVTELRAGGRPLVRISAHLSEDESHAHRLRTTLAHELGHVRLHAFLWRSTAGRAAGTAVTPIPSGVTAAPLATAISTAPGMRCRRDAMLAARQGDWLEWQAGYAAGAYLMPATALDVVVREVREESEALERRRDAGAARAATPGPLFFRTAAARALVRRVQRAFDVSAQAAQVRLLRAGYLTRDVPPGLAANAALRRHRLSPRMV